MRVRIRPTKCSAKTSLKYCKFTKPLKPWVPRAVIMKRILKLKQSYKSKDSSQLFTKESWWWKLASLKYGLSGSDFCIVCFINTFKIPLILFNPFNRLFVSYQYAREHFQTLSNIYESIKFLKSPSRVQIQVAFKRYHGMRVHFVFQSTLLLE